MKLTLNRYGFGSAATIGDLFIDGMYFCKTLEDADRKLECDGEKIYGRTAIPRGAYDVIIDWSNRFKRELPHVLDVPGFSGIRIHAGNKPEDTEGCILVGKSVIEDDFISDSRNTLIRLMTRLEAVYERGEKIVLEVK